MIVTFVPLTTIAAFNEDVYASKSFNSYLTEPVQTELFKLITSCEPVWVFNAPLV